VSQTLQTTPGFIDAHSHLRSTSLESHGVPGATLEESLLRMMAMSAVPAADDAFVACSDLVSAGVTGVQVMFHTFEDAQNYLLSLDALITGIQRSGIRALVILGLTDQAEFAPLGRPHPPLPSWAKLGRGIRPDEFPEVFAEATKRHPEVTFGVGPVGPQWASDELLEVVADIARHGYRIHTHCLESASQRSWAGENPVTRLDRHGLLGPRTSLAHGVWASPKDQELIAHTGTQVVTCPHSNRLLGAGVAPVQQWLQAGIVLAHGMDSSEVPPAPLRSALRVFDRDQALHALTTGGSRATELPSDADTVTWSEGPGSEVWELTIGSRTLISKGRHVLHEEIEEARTRISQVMSVDQAARIARQADITRILPNYLAHVTQP
jgi:cytosine/adenosine deaminase-related metal-dependent hydrolase